MNSRDVLQLMYVQLLKRGGEVEKITKDEYKYTMRIVQYIDCAHNQKFPRNYALITEYWFFHSGALYISSGSRKISRSEDISWVRCWSPHSDGCAMKKYYGIIGP